MRLYIDGLFYKGSGIGRYYASLTKELAAKGIKIYTCVPKRLKDSFESEFKKVSNNIEAIYENYDKFSIKAFFKQSNILKKLKNNVDLYFFPHINLPNYIPQNTVVTIHDLIPLTHFWDRSEIKRRIFTFYLKRATNNSKGIITVSYAVKNDLESYFGNIGKKTRVIYEFIDDIFMNDTILSDRIVKEDYILFIGNRKKHKNLKNLVLAFDKIKEDIKLKLVIAGSKDKSLSEDEIDSLINELNLKERIITFTSPSDEEVINLYRYATLFVFPSLYEGFGLPPLEAISCGCPTITSNIPVLREILGNKIACFDPYNADDIAKKIYTVIKNRDLLIEILEEGKNRLKLLDKNKIIEDYINYFLSIKQGGQ
ncbi:MAG: glycosyltransferase family 4 protein [Candidatus Omnitrophica bacterium]|nr:glycosyltransferase family 4 protein [Candidatus Omnitrophota bacterium]